MPFKILEEIATADIAFEATGETLEEMLKSSALATTSVMIKIEDIKPDTKKEIKISGKNPEDLLVSFLNELLFLKDSELLLFSEFKIKIKKQKNKFELEALLQGQKIDMEKQTMGVDVKAVTYHLLEVKKIARGWKAQVILDI